MKLWNKTRLFIQFFILALVVVAVVRATDPEAYCALGGILSIGSRYIHGASSCQMGANQMALGIGLIVGILLIGKLFCSFVCPIGTVTEWLGRVARRFKLQIKNIPKLVDRSLRILKYGLLFAVLWFTVTSSELFCKTFEPYYAAVTGFGMDVNFMWGLTAIVVTIVGSIFIRQFWCKYLCPLGALSNIFMNAYFAGGALVVYILLRISGIDLSVFWLFIIWVVGGFLFELISRKNYLTPFIKISRNKSSCIDCGLCDKACPYGIEVSKMDKVNDLDCTMCADCVDSCPVANTLTFRKKSWKWVPAAATVVLVALSLGFSSKLEVSTISERWGKNISNVELAEYESVIKTVKCYGTANALKNKIQRHEGIYGIDAYASSHKVVIFYNPEEINELGIKKAIFSPFKAKIRKLDEDDPQELAVMYLGVSGLEDRIDTYNFIRALQKAEAIYGVETDFGEPVRVLIYYNDNKLTLQDIEELVEVDEISYENSNGKRQEAEVEFKIEESPQKISTIDSQTFLQHIFSPYQRKTKEFQEANKEDILIYETGLPGADDSRTKRYLPYLMSHLSDTDGVLGMETFYKDRPLVWIYFDASKVDTATLQQQLTAKKLTVHFSNGTTKAVDNMFEVQPPSKIINQQKLFTLKEQLEEKTSYMQEFHKTN